MRVSCHTWLLPWAVLLLAGCEQEASPPGLETKPIEPVQPPEPAPPPPEPKVAEPAASGMPTDGPRVYGLTRNVWIRSAPQDDVQWIGSLWLGSSVKVRGPERVPGAGCADKWVPIEPRGWVCVDDRRATMNPELPALVRLYPERPKVETAWPHHYASVPEDVSRFRLPPEVALGAPGAAELAALLPFPLAKDGTPDLPPGLYEGRTKMVARSELAYVRELTLGQHTYVVMPDLSFVRRDKIEPVRTTDFAGVELKGDEKLPLAFVQGKVSQRYQLSADGVATPVGKWLERFSHLGLSGKTREIDGLLYRELRGSTEWVRDRSVTVVEPKAKLPWGDTVPPGRATWIEISVLGGWLVAFEGARPVYATMISAGRGGTPVGDRDPVSTASTPTGRFFITGKFETATMESSTTPIVHGDVPWTQNFSGPHAIHSAYWHDQWGNLKSAGCVNVSPRDGKWLFGFTEPPVPEGWHAVKHVPRDGPATLVILHE